MADLAKIISELVTAIRKKNVENPARELILKAEPTGSHVLRGADRFDFPHVFQDVGEFERARGMLGAAFPDHLIGKSHRLGDPDSPMFPQGAGEPDLYKLLATELPDFSPEEIAKMMPALNAFKQTNPGLSDNDALMGFLDSLEGPSSSRGYIDLMDEDEGGADALMNKVLELLPDASDETHEALLDDFVSSKGTGSYDESWLPELDAKIRKEFSGQ